MRDNGSDAVNFTDIRIKNLYNEINLMSCAQLAEFIANAQTLLANKLEIQKSVLTGV